MYSDIFNGDEFKEMRFDFKQSKGSHLIFLLGRHVFTLFPFAIVIFRTRNYAFPVLAQFAAFFAIRSQFDAIVGVFIVNDGSQFDVVFESPLRDMQFCKFLPMRLQHKTKINASALR